MPAGLWNVGDAYCWLHPVEKPTSGVCPFCLKDRLLEHIVETEQQNSSAKVLPNLDSLNCDIDIEETARKQRQDHDIDIEETARKYRHDQGPESYQGITLSRCKSTGKDTKPFRNPYSKLNLIQLPNCRRNSNTKRKSWISALIGGFKGKDKAKEETRHKSSPSYSSATCKAPESRFARNEIMEDHEAHKNESRVTYETISSLIFANVNPPGRVVPSSPNRCWFQDEKDLGDISLRRSKSEGLGHIRNWKMCIE